MWGVGYGCDDKNKCEERIIFWNNYFIDKTFLHVFISSVIQEYRDSIGESEGIERLKNLGI